MIILKDVGTFEILSKTEDVIHTIARAARECYQSQDKSTPENDLKLVRNLVDRGHTAMLEMGDLTVRFINVSRYFTHELVRHRLASYAQSCLTGDTLIKRGLNNSISVKELFDREKGTCYDRTHNKTINIKSVSEEGKTIDNKMVSVWYTGKRNVFEVETKLGYKIKCTENHKFYNSNKEFVELKKLKVNDEVFVNGSNKIVNNLTDEEFIHYYNNLGLCPMEISKKFNIQYLRVIKNLKRLNIFVRRKNDKNKEKYNKNHTKESTEKARKKNLENYQNGRTPWNKGINYESPWKKFDLNKKIEVKKKISDSKMGEKNPQWKNGINAYWRFKQNILNCELCNASIDKIKLENHHLDHDRTNNKEENIIKVCIKCHNLLHHGWQVGTYIIKDKIIAIREIGVEDTYDLEMLSPYNNYIANGFVVHNSTRYVSEKNFDCIVPGHKDENEFLNQDSELPIGEIHCVSDFLEHSEYMYNLLRKEGWKPEDARVCLPPSIVSPIIIKANLTEWRHIFSKRCDHFAYWEIRNVMLDLLKYCQKNIPVVFDDFHFFTNESGQYYARKVLSTKQLEEEIKHYNIANNCCVKVQPEYIL
jgi:thymidylate synthase ThyX/intein/homing endonuclease